MENHKTFIPLYSDLKEKIEDDILARKLAPGEFLGTFHELCGNYNVSITTARKAVDALVSAGFLSCRPSQGIFTADVKGLFESKSLKNFILILHNHPEGDMAPYFSTRLCAMLQVFSENGMTAKVISRGTDPLSYLNSDFLRGIVASPSILTPGQLRQCSVRVPVVHFSTPTELGGKNYIVNYDTEKVSELACEYFASRGFKRFVMVYYEEDGFQEYSEILRGMGIKNFAAIKVDSPSVKCGSKITGKLAEFPSSTAIWAMDDFIAVGIFEGFLKKGIDIRDSGRILAFGNPKQAFIRGLGIPIVGWDPWVLGKEAAGFLCKLIEAGEPSPDLKIRIIPEISV